GHWFEPSCAHLVTSPAAARLSLPWAAGRPAAIPPKRKPPLLSAARFLRQAGGRDRGLAVAPDLDPAHLVPANRIDVRRATGAPLALPRPWWVATRTRGRRARAARRPAGWAVDNPRRLPSRPDYSERFLGNSTWPLLRPV